LYQWSMRGNERRRQGDKILPPSSELWKKQNNDEKCRLGKGKQLFHQCSVF
jgi:hypothetical protein